MLALRPAPVHKNAMPRLRLFLCCLLLAGGAALRAAPGEVSKEDLDELEALRIKVRENNPDSATKPAALPRAPKPGSDDLAELAALKARVDAGTADRPRDSNWTVHAQVIRDDEEGNGFELVLVLDTPVPTPAVMRASGHFVGEKLEIEGRFEGAAKFEGAYYPFLKTQTAADTATAKKKESQAAPDVTTETADVPAPEASGGFGGFQITNLLFAAFGTVSLAIVLLKVKAAINERKAKKARRRR